MLIGGVLVPLPGQRWAFKFLVVEGADEFGVEAGGPGRPRVSLDLKGDGVGEGRVDDSRAREEPVIDGDQGHSDVGAVRLRVGLRMP